MKNRYDICEQLCSSRDIKAIIGEVEAEITNDYFRERYEEEIASSLERSTEGVDTTPTNFLLRLVELVSYVFPEIQEHEEIVLSSLQIIAQVSHIPRLAEISRLSRQIIELHEPSKDASAFEFDDLLRVYRKVQLNGIDLMKASSPLALESEGFEDTLRSGALLGEYLFAQCEFSMNPLFCRLMTRKVLLKCVTNGYAEFLNGFQYYSLNEVAQIYRFERETICEYLQVVFDEYFDVMELCGTLEVTLSVVEALIDPFLLYKDRVIAPHVDRICSVEAKTLIEFVVRNKEKLEIYQVVLLLTIVESYITSKSGLSLALTALFPNEEVSDLLFPAIMQQFDENGQYKEFVEEITVSGAFKLFASYLRGGSWILSDSESGSEAELLKRFINDNLTELFPNRGYPVFSANRSTYAKLEKSDLEKRIEEATAEQMVYVIHFLVENKYNFWKTMRLSENEYFLSAMLYFEEYFEKG